MTKPRIVKRAEAWSPDPEDELGQDKRRLLDYLLKLEASAENPVPIKAVLKNAKLSKKYRREAFQHQILGPLRWERDVFVGTSNGGIFLVTTPEDADATLGFYTWRIRAELRHARNLRSLARRTRLMAGYESKLAGNKDRAAIYIDESGTPDVENLKPRFFVVAAIVVESRRELAGFEDRFRSAAQAIKRPLDHELRSAGLSLKKRARVLRELSLLDFQWAAVAFDKARLTRTGFSSPKRFYRFALQFLIGDLLMTAWQADLVIDENSTKAFQAETERHIREQNSGLPVQRLGKIKFSDSSKARLVQLADLVAGAVRLGATGEGGQLEEIEHKEISLQFWPPR
jgi:hypothetical protein